MLIVPLRAEHLVKGQPAWGILCVQAYEPGHCTSVPVFVRIILGCTLIGDLASRAMRIQSLGLHAA